MSISGKSGMVVVGGYGAVGRTVCTTLAERFPGNVFAAGRNVEKAEVFSRRTGRKVLPLMLDIGDVANAAKAIEDARVVVVCAETDDPGFARACLERGVHYVDVSASYAFLSEVERYNALADRSGATAVLSIGLAPGLTNLLAKRCTQVLDEVSSLDIFVMLGLGEAHGEAAVRWTAENLNKRFEAPGVAGTVGSLEDSKATLFPGGYGTRTAYRFDFADQHVLARTLGVERVATRLCFDSAALTRLLPLMKQIKALETLRYRRMRDSLVAILSRFHPGSDGFVVKVQAKGLTRERPELYSCSIWGHGEGRISGIVTSLVAESLHTSPYEPGVFHIEQLFEPVTFFAQVEDRGFTVDLQDGRF